MIQFRSLVPPGFFCRSDKRNSCKVKVLASVRAAKELTCPDRRTITQAVLEWTGPAPEVPFCGLTLETSTWQQVHSVVVKGVVDTLRDGDQQRTVQVYVAVTYDNITTPITFDLGRVEVSRNSIVMSNGKRFTPNRNYFVLKTSSYYSILNCTFSFIHLFLSFQLLVKDRMDGATCVSLNDPHIKNLNGR